MWQSLAPQGTSAKLWKLPFAQPDSAIFKPVYIPSFPASSSSCPHKPLFHMFTGSLAAELPVVVTFVYEHTYLYMIATLVLHALAGAAPYMACRRIYITVISASSFLLWNVYVSAISLLSSFPRDAYTACAMLHICSIGHLDTAATRTQARSNVLHVCQFDSNITQANILHN